MEAYTLSLFDERPPTLSPPLKWAGGKRWLVSHLLPRWRPYQHLRFVEPFAGGMAITLGLNPRRAWLNDVNVHLMNFYRWLQKGLTIEIDLVNDEKVFYDYRARFNDLIHTGGETSKEAASLFYYLNRTCFNGLCRFNSKGNFNVPKGSYKTINYTYDFTSYVSILKNWTLTSGDFEAMTPGPTDFIYADPPYDVPFTAYSAGGFDWNDQVRLAQWLARHTGPVIASNQATPRIMELYQALGFRTEVVDAPRMISSNGDRTPAKEMLATKL